MKHTQQYHGTLTKQTFQCEQCERKFMNKNVLIGHMKSEHVDIQIVEYKCEKCDEEFNNNRDLVDHIRVHHVEGEWNCNDCAYQGHSIEDLRSHLKRSTHQPSSLVRKEKGSSMTCYTCTQTFTSYHNLMNHRNTVHPSN